MWPRSQAISRMAFRMSSLPGPVLLLDRMWPSWLRLDAEVQASSSSVLCLNSPSLNKKPSLLPPTESYLMECLTGTLILWYMVSTFRGKKNWTKPTKQVLYNRIELRGPEMRQGEKGGNSMAKTATISELERLLNKQKKRMQELQKRKARLTAQIAKIDQQIGGLRGAPAPIRKVRRRRKRRGRSLEQVVVDVLKGSPQPKSAAEITEAVEKAGYRTSSKNLISLVRQVCYKSDQIQTKERGRFVLAGATAAPRARPKRKKKAARK
jgi:hypothetical protein